MYLVVIVVLSIVLAFERPLNALVSGRAALSVVAAIATILPAALALLVTRRTLQLLERFPGEPGHAQAALGRGTLLVQATLALAHGGLLLFTSWPELFTANATLRGWPVLPAVLSMTPFLISLVLVWLALYRADRAVRQIAVEVYLFRGRPVRPVWTLLEYLVYNLRHQLLFVFVPMLLIVLARDLIELNERRLRAWSGYPHFPDLVLGAAALAVAITAPEILRRVWATQRLPDGPLRDRLQMICRLIGMRYRQILVWRAGGMVVNAAVMGVVAPLRYVLITDGMLEQMDDTRVEAVFGHEAGHVKRHHISYFLLFALISGCIVTVFSIRTRDLPIHGLKFQLATAALGLLLLFKWGVLFGWISRRFERQADVFGVRVLTRSGLPCVLPCAVHGRVDPQGRPFAGGDPLCSTAANLFGNTLNEVALLNGIPPEARSWRHGSISARSRTLQRLAQDPRAAARSERNVRIVKLAILLATVAASAWASWEMRIWEAV